MRLGTRKNVEGEGEKAVARQNGAGLVECLVRGWPAPSQVVIVHGGEVIVSQRIAIHAFQRCARHPRIFAPDIEQRRGFHPQAMAPAPATPPAYIAPSVTHPPPPPPPTHH